MKFEAKLFLVIALFFAAEFFIYGFWSQAHDGNFWYEPVGLVGFALAFGLGLMIGGFCWWTGRKIDLRPDDDPEGEISDVEGNYGFFAPYSWWPLYLGGAGALVFLGLAIGWWLVIMSIPLLALASVGWCFEFFRGERAI